MEDPSVKGDKSTGKGCCVMRRVEGQVQRGMSGEAWYGFKCKSGGKG